MSNPDSPLASRRVHPGPSTAQGGGHPWRRWPSAARIAQLLEVTRELVGIGLKLRYKRTVLGVAWSLVSPIAQLAVLGFVFRYIFSVQIDNYLSYLFAGILAWTWFQSSLAACATCVFDNASLLLRPGFPATILPVVAVTTNLVHFLVSLPVLLIGVSLSGQRFSVALVALPFIIGLQFLLSLGLGFFLSTIQVRFRDTKHLLDVFLMLAFYLTPVFYHSDAVPERFQPMFRLNPVLHLLDAYRAVVIDAKFPDLRALGVLALISVMTFALGFRHYQRRRHQFPDEL